MCITKVVVRCAVSTALATFLIAAEGLAVEQAQAEALAKLVGVERGICAVVGADADLLARLVTSSKLLVYVREPDAVTVVELRGLAQKVGVGIDRLIIEHGGLGRFPFADHMVDVVLSTRMTGDALAKVSASEVLRVLRPEGKAIVGAAADVEAAKLEQWAKAAGAKDVEAASAGPGAWVAFTKPALKGVDDWPLWEHGPDNNPVSTDQVIKAPYMTQFMAPPWHICMPAITTVAGGRTFLATGHIAHHTREWNLVNKLIARNGYNGIVLWERDLPKGYLSHRSAFVATKDTFHLIDGDSCLMLDPQTGAEKGRICVPGAEGDWKWMVLDRGVLYVLAGDRTGLAEVIKGDRNFGGWGWGDLSRGYYSKPRVPWGFGDRLVAYQLGTRRVLWTHKEDGAIDSRALAMRDGKLFVYCPDKHFRCLDTKTGEARWTNGDGEVLGLIEKPGRGLVSTPGFRSACMAVATPQALIVQGQTRMNVVALSTEDGRLLWAKKKVSNNPNVICLEEGLVLGIGKGNTHLLVNPVTGKEIANLNFRKAACTRLTACPDSLFVRGEGTLRYDRATKKVLIDGAVRPGCNDGALPANGMLYVGPWGCDCNLSLIGAVARCSAGDFKFDHVATESERLRRGEGSLEEVAPLEIAPTDWPTYRANVQRTSSTTATLASPNASRDAPPAPFWRHVPTKACVPTPPVSAGGLVFVAGTDGKVIAIDEANGQVRWTFATNGPIKASPTVWEGRAYVGSGDGHVYALEAATGRRLWSFRAAPVERHIMVYGHLSSTWPVNTGVLVQDGVAYFAAGIIDYDGTYVYALDAKTGKIKWQNNSCGHLSAELRKGVSAQGGLTICAGELLMAGGNQISPARFSLETGECLSQPFTQGQPKANHGKFMGVLFGKFPIYGGRGMYAPAENVANKDSFLANTSQRAWTLNFGGVPPAWTARTIAMVNFRDGKLTCCDGEKVASRIETGLPPTSDQRRYRWTGLTHQFQADGAVRWATDLGQPNKFEVVSIAVCPNGVVAAVKFQTRNRAHPQWFVAAMRQDNGIEIWFWRHNLPGKPLPEGMLIGRRGQVIVALLDGRVLSFGPRRPPTRRRPVAKTKRRPRARD